MAPDCRICAAPPSQSELTHTAQLLQRYTVQFYRCKACGFWRSEDPYWLDEAYSEAIASTDTGLVRRNLQVSRVVDMVCNALDGRAKRSYVDWAGGYGLMVRLMRDRGRDFRWQDSYAQNVLAVGHDFDPHGGLRVSAVTAVEVLEHLDDPVSVLSSALAATGADTLICTTIPYRLPLDVNWWYLSPETGQHISFYRKATLEALAVRLDMTLVSKGSVHVFTRRKQRAARIWLSLWASVVLARASRSAPGLTASDRQDAVTRLTASNGQVGGEAKRD